jgi:hypothetical protein
MTPNSAKIEGKISMHYTLTLHEDRWLRDAPIFASGQVTVYKVGGMADGSTARIANFGAPARNDWRIMRINADNTQCGWKGPYESVEEASRRCRKSINNRVDPAQFGAANMESLAIFAAHMSMIWVDMGDGPGNN